MREGVALKDSELVHIVTPNTRQDGAKHIAENSAQAIKDTLMAMSEAGLYQVKGAPAPKTGTELVSPSKVATTRPTKDMQKYQRTFPRTNGELPVRETTYQSFKSRFEEFPDLLSEFEGYIKKHNETYNPGGRTYSEEQKVPTPSGTIDEEPVESMTPVNKTVEEIGGFTVAGNSGTGEPEFNLIFTEAGDEIYLLGLKDGILGPDTDLGTIQGQFKIGNAAEGVMANSTQFVKFGFNDVNDLIIAKAFKGEQRGKVIRAPRGRSVGSENICTLAHLVNSPPGGVQCGWIGT
jgi:hypothetical protein